MSVISTQTKQMRRNIPLLYLFNFLSDFRPLGAVGIIYYQALTGSFALAMSIFSIVYAARTALEVPTGVLSDLMGRRGTIIAGAAAAALAALMCALADGYALLAAGAVLEGAGRAFFSGNNEAFLFETLKHENQEERYGEASGRAGSMFQWGLCAGAVLGGLAAARSLRLAAWLAVAPQAAALLVSFFFAETRLRRPEHGSARAHIGAALRQLLGRRELRRFTIAGVLQFSIGEARHMFMPAFFHSLLPLPAVGAARALTHVLAGAGFWFSGSVLRRWGARSALIGCVFLSIAVEASALALLLPVSPFLMAATSVFFGVQCTAKDVIFQQAFNDEQRATLGSLQSFAGSLAFGAAAILLGWFADAAGPVPALIGSLTLLVIPLHIFMSTGAPPRQQAAPASVAGPVV